MLRESNELRKPVSKTCCTLRRASAIMDGGSGSSGSSGSKDRGTDFLSLYGLSSLLSSTLGIEAEEPFEFSLLTLLQCLLGRRSS